MIRSRRNETLKAIRRLRRRQGDHALLEGPHLLDAALDAGVEIDSVLVAPEFAASAAGAELLGRLARPPLLVENDLLVELIDADSPRGVLALARVPPADEHSLPVVAGGLYLFLDGVQDPGNLGAIARVAEAFGAAAVALGTGCVHPNHPRAQRAAAGSLLRLAVARDSDPDRLRAHLAGIAPRWVALDAHRGVPLPEGREPAALVLILGGEGNGISAPLLAAADLAWTIPIAEPVESLNVAVSAGIALHSLRRPKRTQIR